MNSDIPKAVFVVLPASPDDLHKVASLQFEACANDPGFSAIFPGKPTAATLAHLTRQYEEMMESDPTAHLVIAKEVSQGEIVAYAVWHFIPSKHVEDVEREMLADVEEEAFPAEANIELGKRLVKNAVRKRLEIVSECFGMGCPYGYLAAIGTAPKFRKQGAAYKLIEWAIHRLDDKSLPAYVEGTPMGRRLYERLGFREYDRLNLDLRPTTESGFANICMIRLPGST